MPPSSTHGVDPVAELKKGIAVHQSGDLGQAQDHYRRVLAHYPSHADALHLLGVVAHQRGDNDLAIHLIRKAIAVSAHQALYYNNLGAALRETGNLAEAASCYRKALHLQPDYAEAAYNLGGTFLSGGELEEAVAWYTKAIRLKPDYVDAHANLAAALNQLGRPDEALAGCRQALRVDPRCATVLNNMGNALLALERPREAIACYRKCLASESNNPEALSNMGNALNDMGRWDEALACYRQALALNPTYGEACNNMGIVLREMGRWEEASACYRQAIRLKPQDPKAYHNLGNVYKDQGRLSEAAAMYRRAIDRDRTSVDAHIHLGTVLEDQGSPAEAIACYANALRGDPESSKAHSHMVHLLQQICAWNELEPFNETLDRLTVRALQAGRRPDEMPFLNLTRHADPSLNYAVARAWSQSIDKRLAGTARFHGQGSKGPVRLRAAADRITVGYLSNNFKNHPTAHLVQGMFRHHDRTRFAIHCYSYGRNDGSRYRKTIEATCDRFIDLRSLDHLDAARRIYDDRVDILVDLVGYMKAHRLSIPALRPAPIQVRWLGLAGTTGGDFFDYQITDAIVTPGDQAPFYSERLVFMPDCYQVNDNTQAIPDGSLDRGDHGLPEDGFVFCCFCSRYKLDPLLFERWMRILDQVPGSVLWLLGGDPSAEENLTRAAETAGVESRRLVFAEKIDREAHMARIRLADLALDTRIVNGAITTSDALWSEVPVISLKGNHFASRMAASILAAAGLPELATRTLDDYESLAVDLATHPRRLLAMRRSLAEKRLTLPLFDTARYVRHLECAFQTMHTIHASRMEPRGFRVADHLSAA